MNRVAIVGGGIAGLAAARHLAGRASITLIERRAELGGHVRTVVTDRGGAPVALDCGFIVFNRSRYPGFTRMLRELDVASQPSEMSFGVSAVDGSFAYSTRTPRTLFADPRSLLDGRHRRMVTGILAFLARARRDNRSGAARGLGLSDYADMLGVSPEVRERFIYPLAGALWSAGQRETREFPAEVLLAFLSVHGMLRPAFAPRWRTVCGGSKTYVDALERSLDIDWRLGVGVESIKRGRTCTVALAGGEVLEFDQVILAVHADTALRLLEAPTDEEREHLGQIRYTPNHVVVHTDESALPANPAARAAWNYRVKGAGKVEVTYWCNKLQRIAGPTNYMVTLNPTTALDSASIIHQTELSHPCFDIASLEARRGLSRLQGKRSTYYAGAYFGFGFHEDGFRSGVAAASAALADSAAARGRAA